MLSACAASTARPERPHTAEPVLELRRVIEPVCPPELTQALPPKVEIPEGAEITGNDAGLAVYRGHLTREGLLEGRIKGAQAKCPPTPPDRPG